MTTDKFEWIENEGSDDEVVHEIPGKFEVCARCEGHGTHLNPSIGEHAYTQEEFNEAFDDEESREAYFTRGGMYDVTGEECKGMRVMLVPDESLADPEVLKRYYQELDEIEDEEREDRAIRRMENGGYDY
jgi:hypothetical protein